MKKVLVVPFFLLFTSFIHPALAEPLEYQEINDGEVITVEQNTGVKYVNINSGGEQIVKGTAETIKINAGGLQNVLDGGTVANFSVVGGTQNLELGSKIAGVTNTVKDGGIQNIKAGAVIGKSDAYVTVQKDGVQNVEGSIVFTKLNGGTQNVLAGGAAFSTIVNDGGVQNVYGTVGGKTVVNSNGIQNLFNGATIRGLEGEKFTIFGGTQNINTDIDADNASRIFMSFGTQNVNVGYSIDGMSLAGTANTRRSIQNVYGTAENTILGKNSTQAVTGTSKNTTINMGGLQKINDTTSVLSGDKNFLNQGGIILFATNQFTADSGTIINMNGGKIRFNTDDYRLDMNSNLSIKGNGIFDITLRSGNDGLDSDFLTLNDISGKFLINLQYNRRDADSLNDLDMIDIIKNNSSDITLTEFSALNSGVDIGLYHWDVETNGDTVTAVKSENTSKIVNNIINHGYSIKSFVSQLSNSMQKRVGELQWLNLTDHAPKANNGLWVRGMHNQSKNKQISDAKISLSGMEFGYDFKYTANKKNDLYIGLTGQFASGKAEFKSSDIINDKDELSSYGMGIYGIWMHSSGWFADAVLRGHLISQDVKAYGVGSSISTEFKTSHTALSFNLDIGRELTFNNNKKVSWFITPHAGWKIAYVTGDDFKTSFGDSGKINAMNSMIASAELMAGPRWVFRNNAKLQIYGKLGYLNEFSNDLKVEIDIFKSQESFSDGLIEVGLGLNYKNSSGKTSVYFDVGHRQNSDITEFIGIFGLRAQF